MSQSPQEQPSLPVRRAFVVQFRNPTPRPEQYLRTGVAIQDVLEWMYSVDHVRFSYGLKYNSVELEKLSPGTKGIVLLILYLGMDTGDRRPLLVDQPDKTSTTTPSMRC